MTQKRASYGFTIVELLIVMIVIGILATIVTLGYSGLLRQSRSNDAQTSANVLSKKLENYYAATGEYPTDTSSSAYTATLNSRTDSSIVNANVTIAARNTIDSSDGQRSVAVSICTAPQTAVDATAYKIEYWDFNTDDFSTKPLIGNASTTACTTWQPLS